MRYIVILLGTLLLASVGTFVDTQRASQAPQDTVRISLMAVSGLKYDQARFRVPPGAHVIVSLYNEDEMAHNIVFTKPGYREEIVYLALNLGDQGNALGYVPSSDKVIAAVPVLNPSEQQTISFNVPDREAIYPYVCTYPGHGAVMYGAMYVTDGQLPALSQDIHVPPSQRTADDRALKASVPKHPYPDALPAVYRTFMPDCGPAGIAVGMMSDVSYCWDAGECRLRYAWKGGFLDMTENWAGKGNERAQIVGTVFYRDRTTFPFRLGNRQHTPVVDFQGYRMSDNYPTFHYTLDGVPVTERIVPSTEPTGIKRILTFENLQQSLWLVRDDATDISIRCSKGKWEGNYLRLSPQQAQKFEIIITEST